LPKHRAAAELYQNIGITGCQLELFAKGKFHSHQRTLQVPPKRAVVLEATTVANRIKVASDRPKICTDRISHPDPSYSIFLTRLEIVLHSELAH
jgi:hypothetical protein